MKTTRITSRIIGILFLTVMVSWGMGYVLIESNLSDPDYLRLVYPGRSKVITGVLFEIIEIVAVMGIVVMLFPFLKMYNEKMARAYLTFRTLESVMLITVALSALILISLSKGVMNAGTPVDPVLKTMGEILKDLRIEWSFIILTPFYSLAAVILNYVLFKTRLVPRFISVWGLSAAVLVLINQVVIALASHKLEFLPGVLMGGNEVFLGIWLIAKGFSTSTSDC